MITLKLSKFISTTNGLLGKIHFLKGVNSKKYGKTLLYILK